MELESKEISAIIIIDYSVDLRKMKRKWEKYSNNRVIFDILVLDELYNVRLRVILHELLHLRYPNHGKMFTALLNSYLQEGIRGNGGKV